MRPGSRVVTSGATGMMSEEPGAVVPGSQPTSNVMPLALLTLVLNNVPHRRFECITRCGAAGITLRGVPQIPLIGYRSGGWHEHKPHAGGDA